MFSFLFSPFSFPAPMAAPISHAVLPQGGDPSVCFVVTLQAVQPPTPRIRVLSSRDTAVAQLLHATS